MQSVLPAVYVVRDNIDTDQIIPRILNLVPTIPEEYEKLGSYAMAVCLNHSTRHALSRTASSTAEFPIVVAGKTSAGGSSREHAPIALGSAKCRIILAESFAAHFLFRNKRRHCEHSVCVNH